MQYATPISTSDTSYSDPPAPGASPAWTHSSWSSRSETTPIHVPMQMQQIQMQSTHMAMHIQHIQQTMLQQTLANDSWKGKEALLEALLNTIVDCDDRWLGLVIEIVRTSPSPEAAMAAIQSIPLSMNTEHTV
ncbi:hypothetical protein ASPZODRAFT_127195 [Penicilliopsis zonata CBS 506.65]|uniref:Uncharacterized protein n=1 Tax=Penicilliopsis zonata CBS 506.65 TaxID=1073090 RepID=A0A1L9SVB8_9EURO|nr:hypothetical protein ASPZODRAFT_127195 [Penicilliopsis zonata CBS 506.65]OJJ51170.1 hypothetical protein ASPZODRAFT_127195 [Penicilliopsis zonata CBS 506.65]